MKIIEFIGYPGSGKSYISNIAERFYSIEKNPNVLSIEDLRNSTLKSKGQKFFWFLNIFLKNFFSPYFFITFLQILFKKRSLKHLKYYLDIYGSYWLAGKNKNFDYCIISEGFISFPTYLFSGIKDSKKRAKLSIKYLERHKSKISNIYCVIQIFNPSEKETLIHTSLKRNVDVSNIKRNLKTNDFLQTTNDHNRNLIWCSEQGLNVGRIRNNYIDDDQIIAQLKCFIK